MLIVSFKGTLIKRALHVIGDQYMSSSFIGMERNSSANSNAPVILYSFTESGFNFCSNHLARLKL